MLWFYDRYLNVGEIRPDATIMVRDNKPFRQYINSGGVYPLADRADNRYIESPLITNIYAAVTHYFMEKVWDTLPEGDGVDTNFIQEFKRATFYRSLYGYGVVARVGNKWQAIDSRYWWPILVRGEKIGSGLVVPYATPQSTVFNNQANVTGQQIPDRAWTTQLLDNADTALVQDFQYSGITLGRRVSVGRQEQVAIVAFGNGVGDYEMIEDPVLKFDEMIRATSDIINRHAHPHMQAPTGGIQYNEQKQPVVNLSKNGSILPVNPQDKDWQYVGLETDVNLFEFQARMLLGVISAIASVPMATFNIHGLPRLESGEGIQALESPSFSKVENWRLEIQEAVEAVNMEIEWPEGNQNEQSAEGESFDDGGDETGEPA